MGAAICICVDDEEPPAFIPEGGKTKYVVVGLGGATIRAGEDLKSPVLQTLPQGTIVEVVEARARRAHIEKPVKGWGSLSTNSGYVIMEPVLRAVRKYKVVYQEGAFIRSAADIDRSRIVRVVQKGTVLNATGRVELFDGVERVEVEDGWVSMRLREDNGWGAKVLEPVH